MFESDSVGCYKPVLTEIVAVHLPSNRKSANASRKNRNTRLSPILSEQSSSLSPNTSMTQNEEEKDSGGEDTQMSQWLSGGTLGAKTTVLVFRSCVLASSSNSATFSSLKSKTDHMAAGTNMLLNKAKLMAKRLVAADNQTFDKKHKETVLMHDVMASFGPSKNMESQALVVRHESIDSLDTVTKNTRLDTSKERNIDDVLNDINKIQLKRNCIIENTTAMIKTDGNIKKESQISNLAKSSSKKSKKTAKNNCPKSPKSIPLLPLADSSDSVMIKSPQIFPVPDSDRMPAKLLNMNYKLVNTETKLLHRLLQAHGMVEAPSLSKEFNLLWSGLHPKPDQLRSLSSYQRVNHFPRSYELTRKDKLYKNIEKWQYFRGIKQFDFIPMTFLMPREYKELCSTHYRIKGPWIVKPAASSRGRGIYIVNAPEQIPRDDNVVVAKYVDRPMLVGGHKCDLRLYVCVTSIDPLLIYLYEEGLVRFATVKYDKSAKNLWNPCMHLCNYSINKYHTDYQKCNDPNAGNIGHKWTLSALLRHLRKQGQNTTALMAAIEDLIIKSILTCTQSIAAASRVFLPNFNNCFELFGYDILVDENLKPWLLEINLSPSLNCESPLDARVKSALIADTLTLVGLPAVPMNYKTDHAAFKSGTLKMRIGACRRVHSAEMIRGSGGGGGLAGLTNEEARLVKYTKSQYNRRGGYVRIFPSQNSWQKYAQYLDPVSGIAVCSTSLNASGGVLSLLTHNYNLLIHSNVLPGFNHAAKDVDSPPERLKRYESVQISSAAPPVSLSPSRATTPNTTPRAAVNALHRQISVGLQLTPGEARRAFALYLSSVLRRVGGGGGTAGTPATTHAALVRAFLRRASACLRMQCRLEPPQGKVDDKDKCAMIARLLNDFLYMYYRETDLYTDSQDQDGCVPNIQFSQFLCEASEADLEDVLLNVAATGDCRTWLGSLHLAPADPAGTSKTNSLLRRLANATARRPHARDIATNVGDNYVEERSDLKDSLRVEKPLNLALKYAKS